jgi:hypothetical protein
MAQPIVRIPAIGWLQNVVVVVRPVLGAAFEKQMSDNSPRGIDFVRVEQSQKAFYNVPLLCVQFQVALKTAFVE